MEKKISMKTGLKISLLIVLSAFLGLASFSCNRKVGCPANESLQTSVNRKGDMKNQRGKSSLFSPKEMRRMRGGR